MVVIRMASLTLLSFVFTAASALSIPDSIFYQRLFYVCKVWGHVKYYHTEVAKGTINWDNELFSAISGANNAPTPSAFNDSLIRMLDHAGPMATSAVPLPVVPDSLNNNTNFSWLNSPLLSDSVRARLDTIRKRFRPQLNYYVSNGYPGSDWPDFNNDKQYWKEGGALPQEKRLLALFRFWNMINIFYPYKNLIDNPWDSVLFNFIPKIASADDSLTYVLTMREMTAQINDSHGAFSSPLYNSWRGLYYPPFLVRYIEDEMVIIKVIPGTSTVKPGDVLTMIDGEDVHSLRESLAKYAYGSNSAALARTLSSIIMWGDSGNFQLQVRNGDGLQNTVLKRNSTNLTQLNTITGPIWKDTIIESNCQIGLVDMGRLQPEQVDSMFTRLDSTDAIIFDIRNYPNGTIMNLVNHLFTDSLEIGNLLFPDIRYPGRLYWFKQGIGTGTPTPYQGRIMILFDDRTQSQAEYTCMGLSKFPRSAKIGSMTSGADGGVITVYLPGNIQASFTIQGVYNMDFSKTQRIGIIPDYRVSPTIQGIRAGKDEVLSFAMNCSLGIDPGPEIEDEIVLYPNPAEGKINFTCRNTSFLMKADVWVTDIYGRMVMGSQKTGTGLDISKLGTGIYIIVMQSANKIIYRKLIKK